MVTNLFMTGVFAAIINSVAQGAAAPGEAITFMWFSVFELSSGFAILAIILNSKSHVDVNFWTIWLIVMRWMALNAYYVWFWFYGIVVPNPAQCMEPRIFLYANLGAYGQTRTAFEVFAVFGAIPTPFILLGFMSFLIERFIKFAFHRTISLAEIFKIRIKRFRDHLPDTPSLPDIKAMGLLMAFIWGFWQGLLSPFSPLHVETTRELAISSSLSLVLAIIALELEIKWNNLEGLDSISSSGQIIALVIGSLSLVRALGLQFGVWESENKEAESEQREQENHGENGENCNPPVDV